ncbi:alanine racemase [Thiocystis violascens]|uniref:Alanine racemase n=1 Tax=Thiocystis violascens (strain ATCC 17096 / DSM 198 / 6111) TaxID=765911 RepID=I3YF42_THIV6|nr:alanine racemase [Thiocystis violascens]AFL75610.1 alanine racemase [Thiocystis violascens DSM 198]
MKSPARPLRARIHLDAVLHNYRYAKRLAPSARALAVVKANGYGHGAISLARALASEADGFAVACIDEAMELRESGIRNPILLLEGVFAPDEIALADRAGLAMVVHSRQQLEWVLAARPSRPLECWIKLDSGMHRVGLAPGEFAGAHAALADCPHVGNLVAMSHFARADEPEHPYTERQIAVFGQALGGLRIPRSLANSAAILAWPQAHGEWTRPGLMLYGISPLPDGHPLATPLQPAMTLESAILSIRDLEAGEPVGYGGRFVCDRPTRVGVAAVGYADGYPRHARDGTPVAVKGRRTRIIGRVSMDMITLDLTGMADARIGDPVELWGTTIPANEVAQASDTIAYQLFTGIGRRVPLIHEGLQTQWK